MKDQQATYVFGDFRLMPSEMLLLRGSERITIRPKTYSLLLHLVRKPGRLLEKQELLSEVWGDTFIEEGNLNRTVSELRKLLSDTSAEPKYIETVTRIGYRFIADVQIVDEDGDSPAEEQTKGENLSVPPPNTANPGPVSKRPAIVFIAVIVVSVAGYFIWKTLASRPVSSAVTAGVIRLTSDNREKNSPSWSDDGRIRYSAHGPGHLWEWITVNGDGTNPVTEKGRVSPDGTKMVIYDDQARTTWIANADGTNKKRLPLYFGNMDWSRATDEIVVQFEPDGKREAMDIAIIDLGTLEYKNITNSPSFEADPSFSPDAKEVLFTGFRDGNAEIYVIARDGSNLRRLTNSPANESYATFSPDGTQISFNSDRNKEKNNVFIMNNDGSGKVRPLPSGAYNNFIGTGGWSPDGTKFAFSSDRDGNENIYLVPAELNPVAQLISDQSADLLSPIPSKDGRTIVHLAKTDSSSYEIRAFDVTTARTSVIQKLGNETRLSLSPDDKTIAFQKYVNGNTEICLVEIDGTGFRNISNNPALDAAATFSPDGRHIAFISNRGGDQGIFNVYVMNLDGTEQQVLNPGDSGTSFAPAWSADGKYIFFDNDKEDGRIGNFEIFKVPAEGGPETRITFRPKSSDESPAISPDGSRIAFQSTQKSNPEIYLMNPDGSGLLRLTRDLADDKDPVWSADGSKIIFSSNRGGRYAIYEIIP